MAFTIPIQDAEPASQSQENSSCMNSRREGYFGNWAVKFIEVACPPTLTSVTGLKPDYASAGMATPPSPKAGLADNGTPGDTSTMQVEWTQYGMKKHVFKSLGASEWSICSILIIILKWF